MLKECALFVNLVIEIKSLSQCGRAGDLATYCSSETVLDKPERLNIDSGVVEFVYTVVPDGKLSEGRIMICVLQGEVDRLISGVQWSLGWN